jgi:putative membrane protein
LVDALIIMVVAQLLPGMVVRSFASALLVALVLGVFNLLLSPVLVFFGTVLTLPAVILTLGLFYFVVRFLVNVFLLWLTAAVVPGFAVRGTGTLMWGSLLISLFSTLAQWIFR